MALAVPKLDDRQFQDIVDEAKKRIPHYCQEWTDHNVSDPGVTLIELFAWMTDMVLYRLNQVPHLHYVRLMELFGISLKPPEPARTPVTFWLSAPQATPVVIPEGTEVSSTQTETELPVVFSTVAELRIHPPENSVIASWTAGGDGRGVLKEHNLQRLSAGFEGLDVFSAAPQVNDALYFGFDNDLSFHLLGFDWDFDPAGAAGINPAQPPIIWEAATGPRPADWQACAIDLDATKGMNAAGRTRIHLPQLGRQKVDGKERFWVRVRAKEILPEEKAAGMRPYRTSPRLRRVSIAAWGGAVPACHARSVIREQLGVSDGSPGQRFQLKNTPVLERQTGERLVVLDGNQPPQPWQEVANFSGSGAHDRHYTLDSASGELRLGPAVRQPDGTIKLYGAVPPRKAQLIFESYRYGGGQEGNVEAGILNTLKTAIPYISRVSNREAARGGLDAESLEAAMMRLPAQLSSRDRAVTDTDFEFLARDRLRGQVGRVKCIQPSQTTPGSAGLVFLVVVPHVAQPAGLLKPEQLQLPAQDEAVLKDYLDQRRLLGTHLEIRPPAYSWVSVKVRLHAAEGVNTAEVEAEVLQRLYRFLNPLVGGQDGAGWPFGRSLYASEVPSCLVGIPGVQYLLGLDLYHAKPGGAAAGDPVDFIELVTHGLVASGTHTVRFE